MTKQLWEILVPTMFNDGRPVKVAYHRAWDDKVMIISGGMTIMKPSYGKWASQKGIEYHERMIPVRVVCSREEMEEIVQMTIDHYEQLAIMAFKVSNEVILSHAGPDIQRTWIEKNKIGMKNYDWVEVQVEEPTCKESMIHPHNGLCINCGESRQHCDGK